MKMGLNVHLYSLLSVLVLVMYVVKSERNYDVILENVEEEGPSNNFIKWDLTINKYNWTANVIDGHINVLKDISPDTTVHSIGYERRGNRYQESHINVLMSICDFLNETHVKSIFLAASNFPKSCTVTQGNYTVHHMIVSSEDLPKEISGKYWMMRFIVQSDKNILGDVKIYANIDRTRAIRPNLNT